MWRTMFLVVAVMLAYRQVTVYLLGRFGTCFESSEPVLSGVAEAPGRILSGLEADWRLQDRWRKWSGSCGA